MERCRDKQPMLCLSHKHTYRYRDNNSTVYGERRSGRSRYHRRAVPLSVCICSALPAVWCAGISGNLRAPNLAEPPRYSYAREHTLTRCTHVSIWTEWMHYWLMKVSQIYSLLYRMNVYGCFYARLMTKLPAMSVCCYLVDKKSIAIHLSVGCTCRQGYLIKCVLECEVMWKK